MRTLGPHWRQPAGDVAWVGEGWRDLVWDCHRRLADRFPSYQLVDIEDQDGNLVYTALPSPDQDDHHLVAVLLAPVVAQAAVTCTWCGSPGLKRESREYVLVLCDGCDQRFSDPPRPGID